MSAIREAKSLPIHYPDSDGEPMSDNTVQFAWIALVMWNLEHLFAGRPNVFVAGDHLIYPVEGKPDIRLAPDVYVAFGPHKGHRGSYRQALANAVPRTGTPRQIVADGGSDLQKGIALFQKDYPRTISVPDIAHSTANMLKY